MNMYWKLEIRTAPVMEIAGCFASLNMTRPLIGGTLVSKLILRHVFHLECPAADMQVALGIWDFNASSGEMLVDQVIQVASEPARSVTHFVAPGDELEIDCAIAKFLQKRSRLWILERG